MGYNPWGHKKVRHDLATKQHMCVCVYIYTYIYVCIYIHISHEKESILPFATTWMNIEDIKSNETDQSKINFTYMWNLKNKTKGLKQQNRNTVIDQRIIRWLSEGRKRGGILKGTNFQLQNK